MHIAGFIYTFPTRIHVFPTIVLAHDECECCGTPAWHIGISWFHWDIGILFSAA